MKKLKIFYSIKLLNKNKMNSFNKPEDFNRYISESFIKDGYIFRTLRMGTTLYRKDDTTKEIDFNKKDYVFITDLQTCDNYHTQSKNTIITSFNMGENVDLLEWNSQNILKLSCDERLKETDRYLLKNFYIGFDDMTPEVYREMVMRKVNVSCLDLNKKFIYINPIMGKTSEPLYISIIKMVKQLGFNGWVSMPDSKLIQCNLDTSYYTDKIKQLTDDILNGTVKKVFNRYNPEVLLI